ncbi:NAD+ synthase [Kutzneria viridogrisea]|uniref:Glutamine-dependent NAD(+) synthetase n=2 Tax=Kutzneria TaxID=43356 RepID=W5W0S8_9PSEU|nr:NAD+ synthase [Kutzneria albida]AHH94447.1 putative glutamine-dependent NAD(+) synthetase [Kutzneria albida DSM 43870]MBA8930114.1 NAD+ synthase (glutamine-hydrolyzing) [Kutzneria viridogrisea]
MPQLRIALAQVNPCVGDLTGNADVVVEWTRKAVQAGAHVVALPEMVLTGYPVEDLSLRESFAKASRAALDELAERLADVGCGDALVALGYLDRDEAGPRNAAALIHKGQVVARYAKHHLPNYGVFDEFRYFVPGDKLPIVRWHGVDLGLVICEDIWQDGGPIAGLGQAGVDLVLCLNGSPYERNKDDTRAQLVARRAAEAGAPIAYVNLVGGQDELVFDGDSLVMNPDGTLLARAPQFVEHLLVLDLDLNAGGHTSVEPVEGFEVTRTVISAEPVPAYEPQPAPEAPDALSDCAEVWSALVTGLRDYVHKNGFRSVVLGLSGGIDSAVVAALAVDALGADAVYGVSMPSSYSSDHSRSDAAGMAERTGLHFQTQPIAAMVEAFVGQLGLTGLAEENVQARCRGVTLMGLSNQHGHLVLATGNKTELAVGYSTIYGDAVGGFAPIKDVPKTLVWELARWRNDQAELNGEVPPIPENSITKPPSAELRPGQLDTDSLPDYELLDKVLDQYVEGDLGYTALLAAGFAPELVERVLVMVDRAEYKRRQYPPGTKITLKAFGRDRRLPITSSWREQSAALV